MLAQKKTSDDVLTQILSPHLQHIHINVPLIHQLTHNLKKHLETRAGMISQYSNNHFSHLLNKKNHLLVAASQMCESEAFLHHT